MALTIRTMTPEDLERYRTALKSRLAVTHSQAEVRLRKAREAASRAALILKEEFGVQQVFLFGSSVHPSLFHIHSDVDLAVWGLTGREYFRAVGVLQSLDPEIAVDLVAFEEASRSMQEMILREGQRL